MRPPRLPTPIAGISLILSLAVTLSGAVGLVMAIATPARALFIGFEATLLAAGVFGVLTALHRFRTGPALALACVGASVFACGVLSEPQLVPWLMGQAVVAPTVWGVNLITVALVRALIGLAIIGIAAVTVLVRRPRESMRYLLIAAALVTPLAVVGALARVPAVMNAIQGLPPAVIALLVCVLFLAVGVCLSVGIHCAIRSFEVARDADRPETPTA